MEKEIILFYLTCNEFYLAPMLCVGAVSERSAFKPVSWTQRYFLFAPAPHATIVGKMKWV